MMMTAVKPHDARKVEGSNVLRYPGGQHPAIFEPITGLFRLPLMHSSDRAPAQAEPDNNPLGMRSKDAWPPRQWTIVPKPAVERPDVRNDLLLADGEPKPDDECEAQWGVLVSDLLGYTCDDDDADDESGDGYAVNLDPGDHSTPDLRRANRDL